jgi:hypothetical protein
MSVVGADEQRYGFCVATFPQYPTKSFDAAFLIPKGSVWVVPVQFEFERRAKGGGRFWIIWSRP